MAQKTHHFKKYSVIEDSFEIKLDFDKLSDRFERAQYYLDNAVLMGCLPLMPFQTGISQQLTSAKTASTPVKHLVEDTKQLNHGKAGSGEIVFPGPYSRYLYYGKTMVDENTGSPWARKGAKKVLVGEFAGETKAKADLSFNGAPTRGAFWFDRAKEIHKKEWLLTVKKILKGKKL